MVKNNKINLDKIKNYFLEKNIKIQSFKKFNSDASNKEFRLYESLTDKYLVLSFVNQPQDFKKYINATKAFEIIGIPVPEMLYSNNSTVSVVMNYLPSNNATQYIKSRYLKTILLEASSHLVKLKNNQSKFKNISLRPKNALSKSAVWGISLYVNHYKKKIDGYDFILNILLKNLKKNFKKISIYQSILTHGDYFLDNLIFYKKKVWVIDHQDLSYDHPLLDIASLVFDARRIYSKKMTNDILDSYLKNIKPNEKKAMTDDIHLVSLARNLRILGAWIYLNKKGKAIYLKNFKQNTWHQINLHIDHLKLYELRDLLGIIHQETS